MKFRRCLVALVAAGTMQNSYAFTECVMKPESTWLALDASAVWICFEKGNCIYKALGGIITERHLDGMYSTALAAITASKALRVRYTGTVDCNAFNSSTHTNLVEGMWYLK